MGTLRRTGIAVRATRRAVSGHVRDLERPHGPAAGCRKNHATARRNERERQIELRARLLRPLLLMLAALVAACSTTGGQPQGGPGAAGSPGTGCRGDADDPQPGDMICYSGELDDPLEICSGLPEAPIVYTGNGQTTVPGIRVKADNVVIQGFKSEDADSTGIWVSGVNITVQDNTVTQVHYDGTTWTDPLLRVEPSCCATTSTTWKPTTSKTPTWTACRPSPPRSGQENVVIQGNRGGRSGPSV